MRFMVLVMANGDSEAGAMPSEKQLKEMGAFNEELVKAGIMKAGEGLHPSKNGARVILGRGQPRVVDGPFTESKELVAGFWIWECKSREDAIAWAKRIPGPDDGTEGMVEIRQVFEAEEFGAELTPELRAQEERLRKEIAAKA